MILRRSTDSFESVIREHLKGELFATQEHPVEKYFSPRDPFWSGGIRERMRKIREVESELMRRHSKQLIAESVAERVKQRVIEHINAGPEREAEALKRTNDCNDLRRLQ